jgi:hypothetical protein
MKRAPLVLLSYLLAGAVGLLVPAAAVLGFFGFFADLAARDQCPNGSDCHDAALMAGMGVGSIVALGLAIWGLRAVRRLLSP